MIPSPCALRSASCAALIALASAAGIVRVPEAATPAPAPEPVLVPIAVVIHAIAREPRAVRRPRPAPTFGFFVPRVDPASASPPEIQRPRHPSPHRLPFAVGPPPF